MNILQVINAYSPVFGCGPADRCQKMASFLAANGHDVTVFTSDHSWDPAFAGSTPGVEVVSFSYYGGRFCYTPSMAKALKERIQEFDIVHLMNHWTHQNILAYRYVMGAGIPYVFSAMGALPIVYRSFMIKRIYNALYGKRIMRDASALIGITQTECQQYIDYQENTSRIHFLPNAIDATEYSQAVEKGFLRKRFSIAEDKKIILFLGRLSHIKGPDILLDGYLGQIDLHKDSVLVFVGPDYGMEAVLKEKVKAAGIAGQVIFCGPLTGIDKLAAYEDADVFVVPSRQENMSIVAVEACSLGVPTVITDTCDFDTIAECGAGKVVPVDQTRIIAAVSDIVKDPELRNSMARNARVMVEKQYTWHGMGKKLEKILQNIVTAR